MEFITTIRTIDELLHDRSIILYLQFNGYDQSRLFKGAVVSKKKGITYMIFVVIAIVEMAVFYSCYFSKMLIQKRKGIQTDQMGKGKEGFVKFIEVILKTVTCLVPAVELISIFFLDALSPVSIKWIGAIIGAIGVTIFIISVVTMKDSWRAGISEKEKTELVTVGIYQISRNPAFVGFDLLYIGILCMFFNWWLFVVSLFAMIMFHLQIVNVEEDFLITAFGNEYLAYRNKVCRYIGRKR